MKLWLFECKKIMWSKRYVTIMLLFVAAIAFLLFRNILLEDHVQDEAKADVQSFIRISEGKETLFSNILKNEPNDEIEKLQEMNLDILDTLVDLQPVTATPEWREWLQLENEFISQVENFQDEGGDYPLSKADMDDTLTLNNYLLAEDIPPEFENYSYSYPNFLKQAIDLFVHIASFILLFFLLADILTGEFERQSIQLLFTQPNKRTNIIGTKFFSSIVVYITAILALFLTSTVLTKLFGSAGSFDYPVIIEENHTLVPLPIYEYLSQIAIVHSTFIIFLMALYLLYSLILKHTLLSVFVTAVTALAGYGLTWINWALLKWLNPFQYIIAKDAILVQNDSLWYQAIPITIILAILCLCVSIVRVKKSKIG